MGLTSFLRVNGVDFPCPRVGFNYIISTTLNEGRNANNAVVGQVVGRDFRTRSSVTIMTGAAANSLQPAAIAGNT